MVDVSGPIINLLFVLVMIPLVGYAAIWIVRRLVDGDLSVLAGIIGFFALVVLFATAVLVPEQRMAGPVVLIIVSFLIFFPFAETQLEKQEMIEVDSSRIDRAHRELSVRPENLAARFELARALHDRGLHGHAIVMAETLLNGLSQERGLMSMQSMRDKFRAENSELNKWKRELKDPRAFDPVTCPSCKALNDPGLIAGKQCKGPYLLELARMKSGMGSVYGRLVIGFALTATLLAISASIATGVSGPGMVYGIGLALVSVGGLMAWIYRPRTMRD